MLGDAITVSVIVPCHNVAGTLPRCLESVLGALPEKGEIVAVDDGSVDATGEILKSYAAEHACLRVVSLAQSTGVSGARNAALAVARGVYIQFADADDTVEPGFCSCMVEAMERDKADLCLAGFWQIAAGGEVPRCAVHPKVAYHLGSRGEVRRELLPRLVGYSLGDALWMLLGRDIYAARREPGMVWRCCYRRELIEKGHLRFDETIVLNEDALFTAEYCLAAESVTSVETPLYNYRVGAGSATRRIRRDPRLYFANKVAWLKARKRLNAALGGKIAALYRGSTLLSLGEMALCILKGELPRREGMRILKDYWQEIWK